jgi:hypothetical protein
VENPSAGLRDPLAVLGGNGKSAAPYAFVSRALGGAAK